MSRFEDSMRRREQRQLARRADIERPDNIPDDAIMRVLRVAPEQAGMRLDRFVQTQLRSTSRTRSQQIIAQTAFSPAGGPLKKNHRLRADERVILWRPSWEEEVPSEPLNIVHEDAALIALNKPPGLAVHPSARHNRATITSLLREQRPDEHLTLMHRLDRETSGVLLLARTRAADRLVKIQFEKRSGVVKRYLALCLGAPDWSALRCDYALEHDPLSRYRVKMRVAAEGGLVSATSFECLGVRDRRDRPERRYSLIRCTLHSGRQHQIRVHLSALGVPVVGDKLYGPFDEEVFGRGVDGALTAEDQQALELPRQALHAHQLEIDHPDGSGRVLIEAPLYDDIRDFWDGLTAVD